jgi:hypothetical protein
MHSDYMRNLCMSPVLILQLSNIKLTIDISSPNCRMLADPSFLHKMTFELLATVSSSVWWEMKNRKERYALVSLLSKPRIFGIYLIQS